MRAAAACMPVCLLSLRRMVRGGGAVCNAYGCRGLWEVHGQQFLNANTVQRNAAWRESFKLPPEVRCRLFDEFEAADSDKSGTLDAMELSELFTKLGIDVPPAVRALGPPGICSTALAALLCMEYASYVGLRCAVDGSRSGRTRARTWHLGQTPSWSCAWVMHYRACTPPSTRLVRSMARSLQVFENVTRDLGNEQGQVTCAELLVALEGVPDDDITIAPSSASGSASTPGPGCSAFDSVSVQHPSASISAAMGSPENRGSFDSRGVAGALEPAASAHHAADPLWSPDSSQAASEERRRHNQTAVGAEPRAIAAAAHSTSPPAAAMMQASPPTLASMSPFSQSRTGQRSGSWSLSDAQSVPAMPSASHGMSPPYSPSPVLAVENVVFEMQRHSLSTSCSVPVSDDGITISGVVPAVATGPARAMPASQMMGDDTESAGFPSGHRSASWAMSQGLPHAGLNTNGTETSALVDRQVGGAVNSFLQSTGSGIVEGSEVRTPDRLPVHCV